MIRAALLALALATPAAAQDVGGAWKLERDRITLTAAKIAVPTRAGSVALVQTGEASSKGEGIDNVAQFQSADGRILATAYIYLPTYADAALTAYATDRAIALGYGNVTSVEQTSVPIAGQADGAIRQVFSATRDGRRLTTTAAFARIGRWIVKLRATGPAERGAEVTAALDALIAGVTADRSALRYPARPLTFAAPCTAPDRPAAKLLSDDKNGGATLLAGFTGGSLLGDDKKTRRNPFIAFPANGVTAVCVRGTLRLGESTVDLLQPAGTGDAGPILAVLNDAGSVLAVEKLLAFPGYAVKRYAIGRVVVGARIDRVPSAAQLSAWLAAPGAPELKISSTITVKANGDSQVNIDTSALK